jgi:predicted RNA-binding protein associated with RNAse of E/G family
MTTDTVLVTYLAAAGVPRPVRVGDRVVLEARSPAVWFTFPAAHHDIGRFHTPAGELTGYYANILTPVEVRPGEGGAPDQWHTTDLFVDLFVTPAGRSTSSTSTSCGRPWTGAGWTLAPPRPRSGR